MNAHRIALAAAFVIAATATFAAQAQELVRLGNLKFAHYGAISYIKEIAPKCGIKVEEHIFAKGPDGWRFIRKAIRRWDSETAPMAPGWVVAAQAVKNTA